MKTLAQLILTTTTVVGIGGVHAGITIHGSTTDYQETGGDWQTMGTNDIDGDGGLGTDGFIFYGQFDGFNTAGANGGNHNYDEGTAGGSINLPSYVSAHGPGVDFTGIADEFNGYGAIDNPNFTDGTDTLGGVALAGGAGGVGENRELTTFTISELPAGSIVRVGILAGVESTNDGRWDPTSITLSDGIDSVTVGDDLTSPLPLNPGDVNTGWVFFDIDANGVYAISGSKRDAGNGNQGPGVSGITFDSIDDAFDPDTDSDGLLDSWEMSRAGNLTDLDGTAVGPGPGAGSGDFDGDGLTDLEEFDLAITNNIYPNLNPILADSDMDTLSDFAEVNGAPVTDPTNVDTDGDGLYDAAETNTGSFVSYDFDTNTGDTGSDPTLADTDLDGLDDGFEVENSGAGYDLHVDQSTTDFDGDSSTVAQEIEAGTDVLLPDTDGDGFYDGAETNTGTFVSYDFVTNTGDTGTDPLNGDTDDDGLLDGVESDSGTFVDASDTGTSPHTADSDGDGFNDGVEINLGGDPTDSGSAPDITVGYTATGSDWLTAFGANDIDGDGALGTEGFIFYGDFTGIQASNQPYANRVESAVLPAYLLSHQPGADFTSVATGFASYGSINDPLLLNGSNQVAGVAVGNSGEAGSVLDLVDFEISGLVPGQTVRVGILGGIEGTADGRWDSTEIFLSSDNGFFAGAIDLEANPGGVNAGWLFFDLTADGVYTVSATRRANNGGASIGGLTFDSIGGRGAASRIPLTVRNNPNGVALDFTWASRPGFIYNLRSVTTLDSGPVTTWPVIAPDLVPAVPAATLSIPRPNDPKRFYVIEEVPAP